MWNTFENSKAVLLEESRRKVFPEDTGLKDTVLSMSENSKFPTFANAKANAIVHILENAALYIGSEDIFVYKIDHARAMAYFSSANKKAVKANYIDPTQPLWVTMGAYRANMDFGHIAPDWQYLLQKGIAGVIADLEEGLQKHSADPDKRAYYQDRILVYKAVQTCFIRYAEMAEQRKNAKGDFIAANLRALAAGAPETMAQAMQLMLLFYVFQTNLDDVTVRSLGGLDRLLYPYYLKDLRDGTYTKEQLAEITKYFFFEISCMRIGANMPFYVCGMDENGNDATNELTRFLLECYRELDIYDPKIHIMYHDGIDKSILRLVLEMIREGKNSFVFMNTELATRALERIGIAPEDAKKVTVYGCYEPAAEATEVPSTCAGPINMAKSIELVLSEDKAFASFEDFYQAVMERLETYTTVCMNKIASYEHHYTDVCPSMLMSPTYQTSRESGIDVYCGGAKYNNTSIVGSGLATLVDSLMVVKKLVFEEKRTTLDELRAVLQSDWALDPKLRLLVKKKYPKFGNNDSEADALASDIYERFADLINGRKNGRGGIFRCGMFSVDWRFWMGQKTGATPDGRVSGEPLSKNIAASIGQDKNGVTAFLNTLLKLDGEKCPDGYVADVVLHCSAVKDEDGLQAFEGLLLTFMQKGGFSVHFNILSPETLINAQKEPEKYQNLQIRLCGWNVRFVDLDKAQQDEFIKQSVNTM